jgi:hypothetical protein
VTVSPRFRADQYLSAYCEQMTAMWALVSAEVAPPEGMSAQQLAGWRAAREACKDAMDKATRNWRDDDTEDQG